MPSVTLISRTVKKTLDGEGGLKEIIRVALPLIASTASHTVLTFTDRVFLSQYSPLALAACVPASVLAFNLICFFMGTGEYTATIISHMHGAKLDRKIGRALWQGIIFSGISFFLIAAMIPAGLAIIGISGHSEEIIALEKKYFIILAAGGGFVVLNNCLACFFSGRGKTMTVMYISFTGAALNIMLNYLMIFGKGGFPEMGIAGAGAATVAANVLTSIFYFFLIFKRKYRMSFGTLSGAGFESRLFKKLVKFGSPNGFQLFIDILAFSAFIFMVGSYGEKSLAASNIALSVDMVAFMPMIGIGIAANILTGKYIGANKHGIAGRIAFNTFLLVLAYGLSTGVTFVFAPGFYTGFFKTSDAAGFAEIETIAMTLLKVLPFFLLGDGVAIVFSGMLSGAGDTKFKMVVITAAVLFVFIPGEYLILRHFRLPLFYSWVWAAFYLYLIGFIFFMRFKSGKWKTIDLLGTDRDSEPGAVSLERAVFPVPEAGTAGDADRTP